MAEIKNEREQLKVLEDLFRMKRFSDTLNLAQKLSRDFPNSFQIRFLHARTLKALNRLEEATDELGSIMTVYPNNINLLLELGDIFSQLNQYNQAAEQYNKILFLDPFNTQAKEALEKVRHLEKGPVDFVSYQSRGVGNADTLHEFDPANFDQEEHAPAPQAFEEPPAPAPSPQLKVEDIPDTPVQLDFAAEESLPSSPPEPSHPAPPAFEELSLPNPPDFEQPFAAPPAFEESPLQVPESPFFEEPSVTPEPISFPGELEEPGEQFPQMPDLPDFPDYPDAPHDFVPDIQPDVPAPPPAAPAPEPFAGLAGVSSVEEAPPAKQEMVDAPIGVRYRQPGNNSFQFQGEIQADEASTVDARLLETPSIDVREPIFPEPEVDLDFGPPSPTPPIPAPPVSGLPPAPPDDIPDAQEIESAFSVDDDDLFRAQPEKPEIPAPPVSEEPVYLEPPEAPGLEAEMFSESPVSETPAFEEPVQPVFDWQQHQTPPEAPESRYDQFSKTPESETPKVEALSFETPSLETPEWEEPQQPVHEELETLSIETPGFETPRQPVMEEAAPLTPPAPRADETSASEEPRQPLAEEPEPSFVTESAAELYVKQGLLNDALSIYRQLDQSQPDERYQLKINELKTQLMTRKKVDVLNRFLTLIQKKGE